MKLKFLSVIMVSLLLSACSSGKESPKAIAEKWCDLNGKVHRAADGPEKDKAEAARKDYEESMQKKYDKDTAFMAQIGKEVEKCEAASEGK